MDPRRPYLRACNRPLRSIFQGGRLRLQVPRRRRKHRQIWHVHHEKRALEVMHRAEALYKLNAAADLRSRRRIRSDIECAGQAGSDCVV